MSETITNYKDQLNKLLLYTLEGEERCIHAGDESPMACDCAYCLARDLLQAVDPDLYAAYFKEEA